MTQLTLFTQYLIDHYPAILSLVGGGAGLSIILQFILHKFKVSSKQLAYTLINVLAVAGAVADFFISNGHLGVLKPYAGLLIAAQTFHRFVLSPFYNKQIVPFLEFQAGKKPVATTVSVVPLGSATESSTPDFSA